MNGGERGGMEKFWSFVCFINVFENLVFKIGGGFLKWGKMMNGFGFLDGEGK